jgi:hypothetical protein
MDTLSTDGPRALTQLRSLARTSTEPISRHFILSEIETLLYGYRDDLPGALEEYDQWAELHHQQLNDGLRQVLLDKFGALPLLDTYRQSCIRHTKAKTYGKALLWAERGVAMYGDQAANDEWVADLEKRAARASARTANTSGAAATGTAPKGPTQAPGGAPATAAGALMETLTCQVCGKSFERVLTRGRKPLTCPGCR